MGNTIRKSVVRKIVQRGKQLEKEGLKRGGWLRALQKMPGYEAWSKEMSGRFSAQVRK